MNIPFCLKTEGAELVCFAVEVNGGFSAPAMKVVKYVASFGPVTCSEILTSISSAIQLENGAIYSHVLNAFGYKRKRPITEVDPEPNLATEEEDDENNPAAATNLPPLQPTNTTTSATHAAATTAATSGDRTDGDTPAAPANATTTALPSLLPGMHQRAE